MTSYRVMKYTKDTPIEDIEKFVSAGITKDTPFGQRPEWGKDKLTDALNIFYRHRGEIHVVKLNHYVTMRGNKVRHVMDKDELHVCAHYAYAMKETT